MMLFLNAAHEYYRPCLASMAEMAAGYGCSIITSSYYLESPIFTHFDRLISNLGSFFGLNLNFMMYMLLVPCRCFYTIIAMNMNGCIPKCPENAKEKIE